MVKTSKKAKKYRLTRKEPAYSEHLTRLVEKIQSKNLKIVKRLNQNYTKRRESNDGYESESDRIAKECYEEWLREETMRSTALKLEADEDNAEAEESYENWRRDEYDTYNVIDRKTLLSKIDAFEKMMNPKKKVDCSSKLLRSDDSKIMWTSPTYIARHIRTSILKHEWTELAHLLLLLTKHSHLYESYTRELAFLTTLMNTDECKKDLLTDLRLFFVTEKAQEAKEFDVWYHEKSEKDTGS